MFHIVHIFLHEAGLKLSYFLLTSSGYIIIIVKERTVSSTMVDIIQLFHDYAGNSQIYDPPPPLK